MTGVDIATIYELIFVFGGLSIALPLILTTVYSLNREQSPLKSLIYGITVASALISTIIIVAELSLTSISLIVIFAFTPVPIGLSYAVSTIIFNLDENESVKNIIQIWPILNVCVGVFQITISPISSIFLIYGVTYSIFFYMFILGIIGVITAVINRTISSYDST